MGELKLKFHGVLQSWGTPCPYETLRKTASVPTQRTVCGLLGRIMGIYREDTNNLEELYNGIKLEIIEQKNDSKLTDNQIVSISTPPLIRSSLSFGGIDEKTMSAWRRREKAHGGSKTGLFPLVNKEYILNGEYEVKIIIDDEELYNKVKDALIHPKRPAFLGRKCCTAYEYIYEGE